MTNKTPLALLNLLHNRVRTLVAVAGVTFAITLVFMQLGFFGSVLQTAILAYDQMDFDLLLTSPNYVNFTQADRFPRQRVHQALGCADVAAVVPLHVSRVMWRNASTRIPRSVIVLAFDPSDRPFTLAELDQQRWLLAQPDTLLVDSLSRPEIAPIDVGVETVLGQRKTKVVGQFTIGPGFEAGMIAVSEQNYSRLYNGMPLDRVSLGLVQLKTGTDPEAVARELRRTLPSDVRVTTRREIERQEQWYWVVNTSTGIIFGSGVIVAVAFGIVIIYQVLSTEIGSRLHEYATLKAMGYRDHQLRMVVMQQGGILGLIGYVPGFAMALVIYELSRRYTNLPIDMTTPRAIAVFVLTIAMCAFAALMSIRIIRRADPAELF